MTKLSFASAALILALALASKHSDAQQPDLVNSARQRNVVDVQFFADPNFQQTNTPFAYYDFPPIQDGSCSACEDFPDAPIQWGSAVIAYSPTGGEAFQFFMGARCTGQVINTGAAAQTMPTNMPVSSFQICRAATKK